MLRAVSQIVISSAAATTTTAAATIIHSHHAAHRSALVMTVLASRALVEIVGPRAGAIDTPEPLAFSGRPARLLRAHVLPLLVEEVNHPVRHRLGLHVRPPARDLLQHVPAVLAIGLAVRQ